jgi:hypothetical protein
VRTSGLNSLATRTAAQGALLSLAWRHAKTAFKLTLDIVENLTNERRANIQGDPRQLEIFIPHGASAPRGSFPFRLQPASTTAT